MRLHAVSRGGSGALFVQQSTHLHRIATGIHKQPVSGPVAVGPLGLEGDEQADLTVHGGLQKAVYAYPIEHYTFWQAQRRAAHRGEDVLLPGSMGENLTVEGLLESAVWVGDRLRIGSVLLQVTEPRSPCFKFNAKMGFAHAARQMVQAGNSGFYLRVVEPGTLQAGDAIELLPGPRETSIAQINERRRKGRQADLF